MLPHLTFTKTVDYYITTKVFDLHYHNFCRDSSRNLYKTSFNFAEEKWNFHSTVQNLQICAYIASSNLTNFSKQVSYAVRDMYYITQVPNYFSLVRVPRVKSSFLLAPKICLLLLLAKNGGWFAHRIFWLWNW